MSAPTTTASTRSLPRRIVPPACAQYHLAGHTNKGTHILDTHNDFVIDEVWELYRHSVARTGNVATLLEWDADIPSFEVVHAEALKARRLPERGDEDLSRRLLGSPLPRLQRWMQAVVEHRARRGRRRFAGRRAELSRTRSARVIPSKTLTPVERVGVYQGMYLLRMVEALQGDYPAVAHLLGDDDAELVTAYAAAHPSVSYTLQSLRPALPEFLRASRRSAGKPSSPTSRASELAVTEVFDAPESPPGRPKRSRGSPRTHGRGRFSSRSRPCAFAYPVNAYLQSVKED